MQQLKLKHQHEVQKLKNQIDRLEQKNISLERKLAEAEGGYFSSFFKISTTMSAEKADAIFESASKYRADVEHAMNSTLDEVFFPPPPSTRGGFSYGHQNFSVLPIFAKNFANFSLAKFCRRFVIFC